MNRITSGIAAGALSFAMAVHGAHAQGTPTNKDVKPGERMSFFVTSVGLGKGGNLGGLAGADAHCQKLAAAAGFGNTTWRAYLSTQGAGAVNARDRIGTGPWYNAKGNLMAENQSQLHGDTREEALASNRMFILYAQDEKGNLVPSVNAKPSKHDMLTGSQPDGRAFTDASVDKTCKNWTSDADKAGSAQVGHHDRSGGPNTSWNSAHATPGCSQANLQSVGGDGLFYCFAPDVK